MILDCLENWKKYPWASKRFEQAFEFLVKLDSTTPDGRHEIDGENVFCSLQSYETRPLEGHQFEAHRLYADIQYVMEGEESILWAPTPELTVTKPYETDIEFFSLTPNPTDIALTAGRFCVLFPQDAHAPCTMRGVIAKARKAVVKVRL
jgi:YhcH/YjgK/YiaL family protein